MPRATKARRRPPVARHERAVRRLRQLAAVLFVCAAVLVMLVLTAFGSAPQRTELGSPARPSAASVTTGPPRPQVVAAYGALRLSLPVAQGRLTAIGYHAAGSGALALQPVGRRGNHGFLRRLVERLVGGAASGLVWYQLDGGSGPPTSALDVGAAAGTEVYSPVDGEVVAIDEYVLNGKRFGVQVDIRPVAAPSLVVSLTRLRPESGLQVGSVVSAARTRLGRVVDLSAVERQELARHTQDAGNHVTLAVRPAASLVLG